MRKLKNLIVNYYIVFLVYALIGWIYEVSWYLIVRHKFVNRGVLFGPFLPIYGFGMLILLLLLKKFMSKKHLLGEYCYQFISVVTVISFIYTTIIEYTTSKIYRVDYYFNNYGIGLLLFNAISLIIVYLIVKNNKRFQKLDTTPIIIFLLIWIITTIIEYVAHYAIDTYTHKLLWDYSKDFLNINSRVNWDASRNFAIGGTLLLYLIQPIIDKLIKKDNKYKNIIVIVIATLMIIDFIINVL